jgi:hypothetical protein
VEEHGNSVFGGINWYVIRPVFPLLHQHPFSLLLRLGSRKGAFSGYVIRPVSIQLWLPSVDICRASESVIEPNKTQHLGVMLSVAFGILLGNASIMHHTNSCLCASFFNQLVDHVLHYHLMIRLITNRLQMSFFWGLYIYSEKED